MSGISPEKVGGRAAASGMQLRFRNGPDYLATPTHKNLYILNLPLCATTDQLAALFGTFGAVSHCVILAMLDAQARRRGFIDMGAASEAKAAIESLNGFVWHGYPIEVSYAIVQRSGGPFEQASGANVIKRNVPRNRFNTGPRRIPTEHLQHPILSPPGGFALRRSGSNSNSSGPPSPSCYSEGSVASSLDSPITSDPCTIFISGLDPAAILDDEDLRHSLEPYGRIISCFLSKDDQGMSRGFGAVTFATADEASRAGLGLDGKMLNGRRISAHNLHYQREMVRGHSPSQIAHSGVNDYFSKMVLSSNPGNSPSSRGSFSQQLPGLVPNSKSPSNGYSALPVVGGRYSPSQAPNYLPAYSPLGMSQALPSSRRMDQIPMGAIGAAPSSYGRPSPPSSLGYSGLPSPTSQLSLARQQQQAQMQALQMAQAQAPHQQHPFFRSASGPRPIEVHPEQRRSSSFNPSQLGDAFVPKGAAALAERMGIPKSPTEASPPGQAQNHPGDSSSVSFQGSRNQRRTSVESHGSSGSQRSIGSERAISMAEAQSPLDGPGSLTLPWNFTPGGSLGLENLSPASTMSMGSTASSLSNFNTPESVMSRSDSTDTSVWGRSAVLLDGSSAQIAKWNPLSSSNAGTKDLVTGEDLVSSKQEVSLHLYFSIPFRFGLRLTHSFTPLFPLPPSGLSCWNN